MDEDEFIECCPDCLEGTIEEHDGVNVCRSCGWGE